MNYRYRRPLSTSPLSEALQEVVVLLHVVPRCGGGQSVPARTYRAVARTACRNMGRSLKVDYDEHGRGIGKDSHINMPRRD